MKRLILAALYVVSTCVSGADSLRDCTQSCIDTNKSDDRALARCTQNCQAADYNLHHQPEVILMSPHPNQIAWAGTILASPPEPIMALAIAAVSQAITSCSVFANIRVTAS